MSQNDLAVIVHGGAGNLEGPEKDGEKSQAIKEAVDASWTALVAGSPGEVAVAAGLRVLEGNGLFDAGYGSYPNEHGKVFLDVALMRGNGDYISLTNISLAKFPSAIALDMFKPGTSFMSVWTESLKNRMKGATPELRENYGVVETDDDLISEYSRRMAKAAKGEKLGTVGCVVRDASGRIFAGTSTGGTPNKPDGRVGDTPIIGSGVYADDEVAGLSATGHGESFLKSLISGHVISEMRRAIKNEANLFVSRPEALTEIINQELGQMKRKFPRGDGGLIVIPKFGRPQFGFNSKNIAVGWRVGNSSVVSDEKWQVARR